MKKEQILNFREFLIISVITLQATWIVALWIEKIPRAVEKLVISLDFLVYYSAGYIYKYISPTNLYDLNLQKYIQETVVSISNLPRFYPFNHPPILISLLGWAVNGNYAESYFRWLFVLVIFLLLSIILIVYLLTYLKWERNEFWIIGVSGLFFYPSTIALIRGQDSTYLLLALVIWSFGLIASKDIFAGLGLALCMIRPQIALALVLPFVFKRRKVLLWFVFWGSILLIYCLANIGLQGINDLINVLIFSGQGLGFDIDKMATLMGALLRLFPQINPELLRTIGYSFYAVTVIFLCFLWGKSSKIGIPQIGISILVISLFSPHLHGHDLTILFIPSILVAENLSKVIFFKSKITSLIPLGVSIMYTLSDIVSNFTLIYLIILVLLLAFWFSEKQIHLQINQGII